MSIRLAGSPRELFDGPFLLGSQAQAVTDAYDIVSDAGTVAGAAAAGVGNARAIQREAIAAWLRTLRAQTDGIRIRARSLTEPLDPVRRLTIVIPIYGDVAATRRCLESVLHARRAGSDAIVLVNDNPDDPAIGELVDAQAHHPDVFILRNPRNVGFVASVNRALAFVRLGDVLLLNADTEVFPGAIDEMHRVLHAGPDIGTVTALSSNATLFSYPHPDVVAQTLDDIDWASLAAVALQENAGKAERIPTAHGFCMLIRRTTLDEVGPLDTAFGRGYGEENDFSLRAADRGWWHVLAGGALVRHAEAASFGSARHALVDANLALLAERFPDYDSRVRAFAATDPIRRLRWPLDFHRLQRLAAGGGRLQLTIGNWLGGGTARAAADIGAVVNTAQLRTLQLTAQQDGTIALQVDGLQMLSVFRANEDATLFSLLATIDLDRVVIHQLLGFTQDFVRGLRAFIALQPAQVLSLVHVHDYYFACPRVTLIDATGRFCGGAAPDRCVRCLELGGAHTAYRMAELTPAEHRSLFGAVLAAASHIIAPSRDAADRLANLLPNLSPLVLPHPQAGMTFPIGTRRGSATDICLLGAIGPHKGSAALLALARHAWLNHPAFRFHVIGYTDIDAALTAIGNVTVSGKYQDEDLPGLVAATGARIALFLHAWPETFSYTLSEAVALGLIPVVPDIGAPADRVREAGFGVVLPSPADPAAIMAALRGIAAGILPFSRAGARPLGFDTSDTHDRLRAIYRGGVLADTPPSRKLRRRRAASQ